MATQTITHDQRQRWIARTINVIATAYGLESQRDLADRIGWSESKVSRKLHQDSRFSLEDIIEVADALGVDVGELLNGWGGRVPVPEPFPEPPARGTQHSRRGRKPVITRGSRWCRHHAPRTRRPRHTTWTAAVESYANQHTTTRGI